MRYFLLAGEASGDNLGAMLITEIQRLDPDAEFAFWGGDAMHAATGAEPLQHLRDLAFMGFAQVVANLPTILRLMRKAKRELLAFKPDVLIPIDYPGFNLRLSKFAKQHGIRVNYYVSPQIWAWRQGRVHKVMAATDRVMCILPFEQAFYARFGYRVDYTGNPLPRRIDSYNGSGALSVETWKGRETSDSPLIALLPGSRKQEVDALLSVMLAACTQLQEQHPTLKPVVAAASTLSDEVLRELSQKHGIAWVRDSYALLSRAEVACVASGTATLETALFGVPQVVCYRAGAVSVALARRLIKVPYIALVNLILDRAAVVELIQEDCTAGRIASELAALLKGPARQRQLAAYEELRAKLQPYRASQAAAQLIVEDAGMREASGTLAF